MKLSLTQLSDAISQFLVDVRKGKTTGKTPTAQYKLMIQWVKGLKGTNLASDNKGDMPAGKLRLPPLCPDATVKSESKTRSTGSRSTLVVKDKTLLPNVEPPKLKRSKRQHEETGIEDGAQRARKRRPSVNPVLASTRGVTKASAAPQAAKKTLDPRQKKVTTPVAISHPLGWQPQSPLQAPTSRASRTISNPVTSGLSTVVQNSQSSIFPSSSVVSHPSTVQSSTLPSPYPQPSTPALSPTNQDALSEHDRMGGLRQAHSQARSIKREAELPASLSRNRGTPPTPPPQLRGDSFATSSTSKRFYSTAMTPAGPPAAPILRHQHNNNADLMATSMRPATNRTESYGRRPFLVCHP